MAPHWEHVLRHPRAKLHRIKADARASRKMSHYTILADRVDAALG
jgi:phosphoribosylaminoimidazole carboxylase (NCAIR synthetase)